MDPTGFQFNSLKPRPAIKSDPQSPESDQHLILEDGVCKNPGVLKIISDELRSTATADTVVAKHIANAYHKRYLDYLNNQLDNLTGVINDNVKRLLEKDGLRLISIETELFAIAVEITVTRHAAITRALPSLPKETVNEICGYDAQLLINDGNARYICRALTSGTAEQKREIFVAVSEQNRMPFLNSLIENQLIPQLKITQGEECQEAYDAGWRLDFSGVDFSGLNLNGIVWRKVDLRRANFTNATLVAVDFSRAFCHHANFSYADLTRSTFSKYWARINNYVNLPLSRAKLNGANFTGAILTQAFLRCHNLTKTILKGATLIRADLQQANLSDVDLTGTKLTKANLFGSRLCRTNLSDQDLTGGIQDADVTGTNLAGTRLVYGTMVFINGNRTNVRKLRDQYPKKPIIFVGKDDSCVIS